MRRVSIAKFGGSSLSDYEAMSLCVDTLMRNRRLCVVVLSAPGNMTNELLILANEFETPDRYNACSHSIKNRIDQFLKHTESDPKIHERLNDLWLNVQNLHKMIQHEPSNTLKAELLALGEWMSVQCISHIIETRGYTACCFDSRAVIKTDHQSGRAAPNSREILEHSPLLWDTLTEHDFLVTQGFVGTAPSGNTTLLGRGGSDYSAALIAEIMHAASLHIFTDVEGIYTADPNIIPEAEPIDELSYDEAAELAKLGANVLHPAALWPAVHANIPVYIGHSHLSHSSGTWINKYVGRKPIVRAITIRENQSLLTIKNPSLFRNQDLLAKIFTILAQHSLNIDSLMSSEISVAVCIDNTNIDVFRSIALSPLLLRDLESLPGNRVTVDTDLCSVAIIGNRLSETPGIGHRFMAELKNMNLRAMSHGASPYSLNYLLDMSNGIEALRNLHYSFIESVDPNIYMAKPEQDRT